LEIRVKNGFTKVDPKIGEYSKGVKENGSKSL
jgi:hypothetical protein